LSLRFRATSRYNVSNHKKSEGELPKSDDPYAAEQLADLGELQRAYRNADSWRRIASVALFAVLSLIFICALLASRYQHDVLVYREGTHGLSYENEAIQTRTPSQLAVEAQLAAFVKAIRNVPGIDYALVDQNVLLALQMTADVAPEHAHQDMVAYFLDAAHNPKSLGKDGMIRTVLDPVIASPISHQTWTISWAEEERESGQKFKRSFHQGTVMIAEPMIPTDPQVAAIDPAGVEVVQYDLHL
jgi:type IV secretory pathway TrbF-like protein